MCMLDGRMEEVKRPQGSPRFEISDVSESLEPIVERLVQMDDTAGAPLSEIPNGHLGASGEVTRRKFVAQEKIDAVRSALVHEPLQDPQLLHAEQIRLNTVLRDLRIERKNADTFFNALMPAGRERLAKLDRSIEETRMLRDSIDADIEAMLPEQAKSIPRADVIRSARQKIGEALAPALAGRMEKPRKDVLLEERMKLDGELATLRFWQFGRKGAIAARVKEIDLEVRAIDRKRSVELNADRGFVSYEK